MKSITLHLHDLIIISQSKGGLQNCLNRLEEQGTKWELELNVSKNKVIHTDNIFAKNVSYL